MKSPAGAPSGPWEARPWHVPVCVIRVGPGPAEGEAAGGWGHRGLSLAPLCSQPEPHHLSSVAFCLISLLPLAWPAGLVLVGPACRRVNPGLLLRLVREISQMGRLRQERVCLRPPREAELVERLLQVLCPCKVTMANLYEARAVWQDPVNGAGEPVDNKERVVSFGSCPGLCLRNPSPLG